MDKLKWETVEYPIADFASAGKVITQRDILEKYKAEHPDEEVKTFAGFKCNQQDKTVSLRIAIVDPTIAADSGTVAKIESVWAGENRCLCGASGDNIEPHGQKLQYPGYDGLVKKYDELQQELNKTGLALLDAVKEVEGLKTKYDELLIEVRTLRLKAAGREELSKELDELKNQLRCSNDVFLGSEKNYLELKEKYDALYIVHEELKVELEQTRITLFADEDSADLAEAKKAIVEDDSISLDEVEDAVENQEPVTVDAQVNGVEIKVADTKDTPEGELDNGTPDCRSDGTVPEDNENE